MNLLVAAVIAAVLFTAPSITLEEGATFDEGACWEADGTEGISALDGQCITPADYDEMYSFENLSTVPSINNPDVSIAEQAGLVEDSTPASEQLIGEGVVEVPFTFVQYVAALHEPHLV